MHEQRTHKEKCHEISSISRVREGLEMELNVGTCNAQVR
jgi:hypothetical protein